MDGDTSGIIGLAGSRAADLAAIAPGRRERSGISVSMIGCQMRTLDIAEYNFRRYPIPWFNDRRASSVSKT
jgi:hypothetical protein